MIAEASPSHPDPIDAALAELELYAAEAWSNQAIIERVQRIRSMRQIETVRLGLWSPPPDNPDPDHLVVTPDTRWP